MDNKRNEQELNALIRKYLKKYDCYIEDRPQDLWIIKKSPLGGFGVFAKEDIQVGELIFLDFPVLLGPRYLPDLPLQCTICYSGININKCERNCGLFVCTVCSTSETHLPECQLLNKIKNGCDLLENSQKLLKCLTPLRSLLLDEEDLEVVMNLKSHQGTQHGHEVEVLAEELNLKLSGDQIKFLYFVCTVLDANAFEVLINNSENSLRGLYPLGSLVNHRCFPNTFHVFDHKHRMVVRASFFIAKDTEIFHSYTRLLWGTITRNFHLKKTKHFLCNCDRCKDPSEFGTYLSAVSCKKCSGKLLPINPQLQSNWKCEICMTEESVKIVGKTLSLVGSVLRGFGNDDFKLIYAFLKTKLATLMPESNEVAVELKYKIVWILGHTQGYLWNELSWDLLMTKRQFCKDILDILEKLKLGKCKIRGLLCYELYSCIEEMNSRQNPINSVIIEDSNVFLLEAVDILKYDVSAHNIVKQKVKLN